MSESKKIRNGFHSNEEEALKNPGYGHRHVQTLLVFSVMTVCYMVRSNMSVGIIAITDVNANTTDVNTYDWDKKTQDFVLSSFYWGYTLTQIPAAQLAHQYGAKILFTVAMVVSGVVSIILPSLVYLGGWQAACALRAIQGLTQSCIMPCIQIFLGKWSPVNERSRLGNFMIAGSSFGLIIGLPMVGYLAHHHGWPSSFQAIGGVALLMGVVCIFFSSDSPAQHRSISLNEKAYIEASIGQKGGRKALPTPWRAIFTSKVFYVILITHTGCYWGFVIMLLETPSYLNMALGINTKQSGIYSSLPYIAMWVFGIILSFLADMLIEKKILTVTNTRKLSNTIGSCGLGLGLVILSFIPTSEVVLSLVVLTIAIGLSSGLNFGVFINHSEVSPNFGGTLMGISNCLANGIGTFAPISAGYILKDPKDLSQWRLVFMLTAAIMCASNFVFVLFGTSEKQPWNEPLSEQKDIEMRNVTDGDTTKGLLEQ